MEKEMSLYIYIYKWNTNRKSIKPQIPRETNRRKKHRKGRK